MIERNHFIFRPIYSITYTKYFYIFHPSYFNLSLTYIEIRGILLSCGYYSQYFLLLLHGKYSSMKFSGPKSIKVYIKEYFKKNAPRFKDKIIIDIPAGNGVSTEILDNLGARVEPYDLLPDFFTYKKLECKRGDLGKKLDIPDQYADYILCQEGIEHLSDQLAALKELNRILKPGGILILTTPNYSNLRSRISYLLAESEYFNKMMPPNEIDSIWMVDNKATDEIYYGHIFLTGIQKLRVLTKLSGFEINKFIPTRANGTSLFLFTFIYPLIWLVSHISYRKALRKKNAERHPEKTKVYREIASLMRKPLILLDGYLFVEFKKVTDVKKVKEQLKGKYADYDIRT